MRIKFCVIFFFIIFTIHLKDSKNHSFISLTKNDLKFKNSHEIWFSFCWKSNQPDFCKENATIGCLPMCLFVYVLCDFLNTRVCAIKRKVFQGPETSFSNFFKHLYIIHHWTIKIMLKIVVILHFIFTMLLYFILFTRAYVIGFHV